MQVYVNAPNEASGPIPEDVKPYFDGPYYEWWNAEKVTKSLVVPVCATAIVASARVQDEERDRVTYRGWDTSKEFLEQVVKEQGPFDGVMGFSQVLIRSRLKCWSMSELARCRCTLLKAVTAFGNKN